MDDRALARYGDLEAEITAEILLRLQSSPKLSLRDCFPELRPEAPYARLNLHPFWVGLPFYRSLLFDVYPFADEATLDRVHGVTASQLRALHDEGKIHFILSGRPSDYRNLDYLDPVLETHPPSYPCRLFAYSEALLGTGSFNAVRHEGGELFCGKLSELWQRMGVATALPVFEGSVVASWLNIRALGLDEITRFIRLVAAIDAGTAALLLEVYHDLACGPYLTSLGGCHSSNAAYLKLAADTAFQGGPRIALSEMDFEGQFPVEVGRFLSERYSLVRSQSLSHALEIYPDYEGARSAFQALWNCVQTTRSGTLDGLSYLEPLACDVARAFGEVQQTHERKKTVETMLQVLGVIGAVGSTQLKGAPGIISSLAFGALTTKVSGVFADRLARLGLPGSIVALWDFDGKVSSDWLHHSAHT